MGIILQTLDGKTPEEGIRDILHKVANDLRRNSGKAMAEGMVRCVRDHISQLYPGSKHWNPKKVNVGTCNANVGTASIDIPGISRAYHNIDIFPKKANYLTIPLHKQAFTGEAKSFSDLFPVRTKNNLFLAKRLQAGGLQFMYLLSKKVRQRQKKILMPADDQLAEAMFSRIKLMLDANSNK